MNFKRNCFTIMSMLATTFLVAGCGESHSFKHVSYIDEVVDHHMDEVLEDGKVIRYGDYSNYIAMNSKGEGVDLGSTIDVMRNNSNKKFMDSTGDQKLLVVPVDFADFTCAELGVKPDKYFDNLNRAFFGSKKNTAYASVAEYFNISSYGKLRLDGEVVNDFFRFPKKASEIKEKKTDRTEVLNVYSNVLTWLRDQKQINLNDYVIGELEEDEDPIESKKIPIYLVYTYPIELNSENSNFFWAYTFSEAPISWSSYSFMYTQYGVPDSHTYIHETGHLFGLHDYYPTEEQSGVTLPDPTGRIDMMDCSIGDETAFSKMYLNWARPYHVTDEATLTLKPLTTHGDLVLLNNSWNKTVYDEYFLLEYYIPTGLNAYDSSVGNSEAKLPNIPGIKVYHVDARLGYFVYPQGTTRNRVFSNYCNEAGVDPSSSNIEIAHDNNTYSSTESGYKRNYLYELILNNSTGKSSGCAQNYNLYHKGDEISGLTFNNGVKLNYSIKINSMNFQGCEITVSKNI